MEAPLNAPPPLLERLVLLAIPPASREAVGGDLRELYRGPGQYAAHALGTLPYLIASQIRRTVNLPVLAIEGTIVFALLGGFWTADHAALLRAGIATGVVLAGLILFEVYRSEGPPSPKRAILEAVAVGAGVLLYCQSVLFSLRMAHNLDLDRPTGSVLIWFVIPFALPIFCGVRAAMILARERWERTLAAEMSPGELVLAYGCFRTQMARRNRIDVAVLLMAVAVFVPACRHFALPLDGFASLIAAVFLTAATYLALYGWVPAVADEADFVSLGARYTQEIERQRQLRAVVAWLWPLPVLFVLYAGAGARPLQMLMATIATVFLSFLVTAANRERDGQARELAGQLSHMRERRPG